MYTLMIEKRDGTQITSRQIESSIAGRLCNDESGAYEIWLADEAGNTVDHWCLDEDDEDYGDDDGQPTEYEEWQDYMGGDDWDHGQYDY